MRVRGGGVLLQQAGRRGPHPVRLRSGRGVGRALRSGARRMSYRGRIETSLPQTTRRYREVYSGVQVVRVMK